jgi:hypothetical protein
VLVPVALADTLLRVAEKGLYRPLWSERILGEAQAAIAEIHPGIDTVKRFADDDRLGQPIRVRVGPCVSKAQYDAVNGLVV